MDYTANVRATVERASADDWLAGAEWYRVAHATAERLAADYRCSVDTAARVIAVLSPRKRWAENVAAAEIVLRAKRNRKGKPEIPGTLGANLDKAWRIVSGDPDALRGPKVERFYRNIMGDDTEVTLDVWAMRAAGSPLDAPNGERMYAIIADAYRAVAREYGIPVSALQAVAWIVVRGRAD